MPPESATALECLLREVQADPPVRSPRARSSRVLQSPFDAAARDDLSDVINGEFGVESNEGGNSWVVHYTSTSSIVSMLENMEKGYLRMYGTSGSNDPGEGRYVDTVDLPGSWNIKQWTHRYAYVASFIQPDDQKNLGKAADNLPFWRLYGREGTGCSLTVSLRLLQQDLLAVKYGPKDTRDSVARLGSAIGHLQKTAEIVADEIGVSAQSLDQMVDFAMGKVRYLYKSEAYDYEKECRVVETPSTIDDKGIEAQFDYSGPPGQQWPKRYINHDRLAVRNIFTTGCIITLGQAVLHKEETKDYVQHLLNRASLAGPEVRCSQLDYKQSTNHH